ncbi:MAG: hypothetical protein GY868_10930 [Deltaproteobacteria bacterium]|nr:hypothetical protein [Deltaproteobacteria bacterium]
MAIAAEKKIFGRFSIQKHHWDNTLKALFITALVLLEGLFFFLKEAQSFTEQAFAMLITRGRESLESGLLQTTLVLLCLLGLGIAAIIIKKRISAHHAAEKGNFTSQDLFAGALLFFCSIGLIMSLSLFASVKKEEEPREVKEFTFFVGDKLALMQTDKEFGVIAAQEREHIFRSGKQGRGYHIQRTGAKGRFKDTFIWKDADMTEKLYKRIGMGFTIKKASDQTIPSPVAPPAAP